VKFIGGVSMKIKDIIYLIVVVVLIFLLLFWLNNKFAGYYKYYLSILNRIEHRTEVINKQLEVLSDSIASYKETLTEIDEQLSADTFVVPEYSGNVYELANEFRRRGF